MKKFLKSEISRSGSDVSSVKQLTKGEAEMKHVNTQGLNTFAKLGVIAALFFAVAVPQFSMADTTGKKVRTFEVEAGDKKHDLSFEYFDKISEDKVDAWEKMIADKDTRKDLISDSHFKTVQTFDALFGKLVTAARAIGHTGDKLENTVKTTATSFVDKFKEVLDKKDVVNHFLLKGAFNYTMSVMLEDDFDAKEPKRMEKLFEELLGKKLSEVLSEEELKELGISKEDAEMTLGEYLAKKDEESSEEEGSDEDGKPGDEDGKPGDEDGKPGDEDGKPGDEAGKPGDQAGVIPPAVQAEIDALKLKAKQFEEEKKASDALRDQAIQKMKEIEESSKVGEQQLAQQFANQCRQLQNFYKNSLEELNDKLEAQEDALRDNFDDIVDKVANATRDAQEDEGENLANGLLQGIQDQINNALAGLGQQRNNEDLQAQNNRRNDNGLGDAAALGLLGNQDDGGFDRNANANNGFPEVPEQQQFPQFPTQPQQLSVADAVKVDTTQKPGDNSGLVALTGFQSKRSEFQEIAEERAAQLSTNNPFGGGGSNIALYNNLLQPQYDAFGNPIYNPANANTVFQLASGDYFSVDAEAKRLTSEQKTLESQIDARKNALKISSERNFDKEYPDFKAEYDSAEEQLKAYNDALVKAQEQNQQSTQNPFGGGQISLTTLNAKIAEQKKFIANAKRFKNTEMERLSQLNQIDQLAIQEGEAALSAVKDAISAVNNQKNQLAAIGTRAQQAMSPQANQQVAINGLNGSRIALPTSTSNTGLRTPRSVSPAVNTTAATTATTNTTAATEQPGNLRRGSLAGTP